MLSRLETYVQVKQYDRNMKRKDIESSFDYGDKLDLLFSYQARRRGG